MAKPPKVKLKVSPLSAAKEVVTVTPYQLANEKAPLFGQSADPHARSLQQGFEHGWNHGTTGDITSFDRSMLGETTGANSAKKGFFFARDPQNPPEHLTKKSTDQKTIEMLRKAGVDVDALNTVSMEGNGAQTASDYSRMGGSREYKEAMRNANAAEARRDWDEHDRWMQIAENDEITRMRNAQSLVAKHGDVRDVMLDKIQRAFYDPMAGKSQSELEAFDKQYSQLFPYNWWQTATPEQFKSIENNIVSQLGKERAAPVLDSIKQYQSVTADRIIDEYLQSGSNVIPAALRYKNPLVHDFEGNSYRDQSYSDLVDKALQNNHDALILKNTYDPGVGEAKLIDVGVVFDPKNIRSKFAAFDPEHTDSTDITKAHGGIIHKADGGMVDSVPEEAIKNTVRDPQAARLLDLDLAKYALMNQPQRMAGGGTMKKIVKPAVNAVMPKLHGEFPPAMRPPEALQWTAQTDDMMTAPLKNGWTATLYHGGDKPELSIFNPFDQEMGAPKQYKDINEAMLAAPAWIEKGITPDGIRPGDPMTEGFAQGGAVRMAGGGQVMSEAIGGQVQTPIQGDMGKMTFDQYRTSIGMHEGGRHMAEGGQAAAQISGDQFHRAANNESLPTDNGSLNRIVDLVNSGMSLEQAAAEVRRKRAKMADGGQVQRFDEGGEVSQDQMRYELSNSPVMQATPRSFMQDALGTVGGYMDKAGRFVSDALEPIAESHPRQHFIANMLLADPLKGAGTALQDYTGTVRETDEDNPVRGVISKDWKNLTTSREPMLDPRVLDVAQFAAPVVKGITKLGQAGAKAITPFAKSTAEMAAELYGSGKMPGMVAPNAYMAEPSAPKPEKILAPANEQGFYSPTEAAALNLQRKTGNGQAFMNDLLKQENVRPDEIKAMGLDTFLKDKKNVTAAEVQDYIAQNKLGLGESVYGGKIKEDPIGIAKRKEIFDSYEPAIQKAYKDLDSTYDRAEQQKIYDRLDEIHGERDEMADAAYKLPESKDSKFSKHQLPGGENYREVVLTLPNKPMDIGDAAQNYYKNFVQRGGEPNWSELPEAKQQEIIGSMPKQAKDISSSPEYRSSHWDEPNVLAHLRMSDRVTDGKKTLLVDEVQSDWHQAGRERGYRTPEAIAKQAEINQQLKRLDLDRLDLYDELKAIQLHDPNYPFNNDWLEASKKISENTKQQSDLKEQALSFGSIPDAPYKEDWYQLALRRAVKEAIDGGYDRVALPTGARVNERFSLIKHVDEIGYNQTSKQFFSYKDGNPVVFKDNVQPEELKGIVGKEVAQKLLDAPIEKQTQRGAENIQIKSLKGQDLNIGGEGNRKYYDEIYPGYLKKFGKKYGASVGKTTVDADGVAEPLHYMEITPAMRKEFSTGIHMKRGGKVSFAKSADEMRKELLRNKHG